LQAIVEHDLVPTAADISGAELRYLRQRVRQAPYAGTIDGLLREIFREFARDIGFDEMPSVGNDALLKRVHRDCYESLRNDPEHARRLRDLEAAYPDGEYDEGVDEMLADALTYCRAIDASRPRRSGRSWNRHAIRRIPAGSRTRSTISCDPSSDLPTVTKTLAEGTGERVRETVIGPDRERLLDADRELYDAWDARIDDFCTVLSAYRTRYRAAVREYGAVSHTDVASLVDAYFDRSGERSDLPEPLRSRRRLTP